MNITDISDITFATQDQFINIAHGFIGKPSLIIGFISVIISFWIACLFVNHGEKPAKKQWNKLTKIFGLMILLVTVIFSILYFAPLLTYKIVEFFAGA